MIKKFLMLFCQNFEIFLPILKSYVIFWVKLLQWLFYLKFAFELLFFVLHEDVFYLSVLVVINNLSVNVRLNDEILTLFWSWPDFVFQVLFLILKLGEQEVEVLFGLLNIILSWNSYVLNFFITLYSCNEVAAPTIKFRTFLIFSIIL